MFISVDLPISFHVSLQCADMFMLSSLVTVVKGKVNSISRDGRKPVTLYAPKLRPLNTRHISQWPIPIYYNMRT